MKEQELIEESKKLRLEVAELRNEIKSFTERASKPPSVGLNQRLKNISNESNLVALLFGLTGVGVALLIYAVDFLNQAMGVKPTVPVAWVLVFGSLGVLFLPAWIVSKFQSKK